MARTLTLDRMLLSIAATYKNVLTDLVEVIEAPSMSFTDTLATGTGADQADRLWSSAGRVLTSGSGETIDLYDLAAINIGAGAGLDALGQSFALAEIACLAIKNLASSVGNLLIGGEGTAATWNSLFDGSDTAKLTLRPGGVFVAYAPVDPAYAVADVANHLLRIAASGGDVTYDILFIGRSA